MIPPSQYRHNDFGNGAEAGGAAALETDVMRFMAILALCLVAIFALVQTLPLHSVPASAPLRTASAGDAAQARATNESQRQAQPVARPEELEITPVPPVPFPPPPARIAQPPRMVLHAPPAAPITPQVPERRNDPVEKMPTAEQTPASQQAPPAPFADEKVAQEAVTGNRAEPVSAPVPAGTAASLRFVTDEALLSLVAQRRVRFYALTGEPRIWSLWVRGSAAGFVSAEAPSSLYEMERASVPDAVLSAFERDTTSALERVSTWGVALPADIRAQLAERLERRAGISELLILADGSVQERTP